MIAKTCTLIPSLFFQVGCLFPSLLRGGYIYLRVCVPELDATRRFRGSNPTLSAVVNWGSPAFNEELYEV